MTHGGLRARGQGWGRGSGREWGARWEAGAIWEGRGARRWGLSLEYAWHCPARASDQRSGRGQGLPAVSTPALEASQQEPSLVRQSAAWMASGGAESGGCSSLQCRSCRTRLWVRIQPLSFLLFDLGPVTELFGSSFPHLSCVCVIHLLGHLEEGSLQTGASSGRRRISGPWSGLEGCCWL